MGITLGELIDRLREIHGDGARRRIVSIADAPFLLSPAEFLSYRGNYTQLALSVTAGDTTAVEALLRQAEGMVGGLVTGYKGGEYAVNRETPIWLASYGECSNTELTGVRSVGDDYRYELTWHRDGMRRDDQDKESFLLGYMKACEDARVPFYAKTAEEAWLRR